MICRNCGKELKENAKFCAFCGEKVEQSAEEEEKQHTQWVVGQIEQGEMEQTAEETEKQNSQWVPEHNQKKVIKQKAAKQKTLNVVKQRRMEAELPERSPFRGLEIALKIGIVALLIALSLCMGIFFAGCGGFSNGMKVLGARGVDGIAEVVAGQFGASVNYNYWSD